MRPFLIILLKSFLEVAVLFKDNHFHKMLNTYIRQYFSSSLIDRDQTKYHDQVFIIYKNYAFDFLSISKKYRLNSTLPAIYLIIEEYFTLV